MVALAVRLTRSGPLSSAFPLGDGVQLLPLRPIADVPALRVRLEQAVQEIGEMKGQLAEGDADVESMLQFLAEARRGIVR